MKKIQLLSPQEVQKIAAGEVIERPSNIVKELVENSLDAQATAITLILEDGGKKSIQLIDNGHGMSYEDAKMSILPHATSKISGVDELYTITSFGFRGEGLASIAAVSKMTLTTKRDSDLLGTQLIIQQGSIVHESMLSCNTGTHIIIEDIFDAIPVRKKFLKTKDTESRAIYHYMHALALSHHTCSFTIEHDGMTYLKVGSAHSKQERFSQLFDNCASSLRSYSLTSQHAIAIEGTATHHQYHRYDRNLIFFFINGRPIKNFKLHNALMRGYAGILPDGRFPAAALFITCPTNEVDINVHPRKEEVMFLHPIRIEDAIKQWAQQLLEQAPFFTSARPDTNTHVASHIPVPSFSFTPRPVYQPPSSVELINEPISLAQSLPLVPSTAPYKQHSTIAQETNFIVLAQLSMTYILIEHEGLLIIDQHAAHERVLYEEYEAICNKSAAINLLFPPLISLTKDDMAILELHEQFLSEQGITFQQHAHTMIMLKTVPLILKNQAGEDMVRELITILKNSGSQQTAQATIAHKTRALMACKGAVKAGDLLSKTQLYELVEKLLSCPNRMTCPHGRPTMWKITGYELEKYFKRVT